ncbi:hypothetical protein [Prosthecobacter sp.]|uniref:hypothetical protein n=1 Tax=Prosthecobacter sp. TaxID=1965333 RepID=UPI0037851640
MNPKQLLTSALNLRNRAKVEENKERAAAWEKEAGELEAMASELEKQTPAAAPASNEEAPTAKAKK